MLRRFISATAPLAAVHRPDCNDPVPGDDNARQCEYWPYVIAGGAEGVSAATTAAALSEFERLGVSRSDVLCLSGEMMRATDIDTDTNTLSVVDNATEQKQVVQYGSLLVAADGDGESDAVSDGADGATDSMVSDWPPQPNRVHSRASAHVVRNWTVREQRELDAKLAALRRAARESQSEHARFEAQSESESADTAAVAGAAASPVRSLSVGSVREMGGAVARVGTVVGDTGDAELASEHAASAPPPQPHVTVIGSGPAAVVQSAKIALCGGTTAERGSDDDTRGVDVTLACRDPALMARWAPSYLGKAVATRLRKYDIVVSPYSGLLYVGDASESAPVAAEGGAADDMHELAAYFQCSYDRLRTDVRRTNMVVFAPTCQASTRALALCNSDVEIVRQRGGVRTNSYLQAAPDVFVAGAAACVADAGSQGTGHSESCNRTSSNEFAALSAQIAVRNMVAAAARAGHVEAQGVKGRGRLLRQRAAAPCLFPTRWQCDELGLHCVSFGLTDGTLATAGFWRNGSLRLAAREDVRGRRAVARYIGDRPDLAGERDPAAGNAVVADDDRSALTPIYGTGLILYFDDAGRVVGVMLWGCAQKHLKLLGHQREDAAEHVEHRARDLASALFARSAQGALNDGSPQAVQEAIEATVAQCRPHALELLYEDPGAKSKLVERRSPPTQVSRSSVARTNPGAAAVKAAAAALGTGGPNIALSMSQHVQAVAQAHSQRRAAAQAHPRRTCPENCRDCEPLFVAQQEL